MKFTQEHFKKSAEKWAALYEAVKGIESSDGKISTAMALFKQVYPNYNAGRNCDSACLDGAKRFN